MQGMEVDAGSLVFTSSALTPEPSIHAASCLAQGVPYRQDCASRMGEQDSACPNDLNPRGSVSDLAAALEQQQQGHTNLLSSNGGLSALGRAQEPLNGAMGLESAGLQPGAGTAGQQAHHYDVDTMDGGAAVHDGSSTHSATQGGGGSGGCASRKRTAEEMQQSAECRGDPAAAAAVGDAPAGVTSVGLQGPTLDAAQHLQQPVLQQQPQNQQPQGDGDMAMHDADQAHGSAPAGEPGQPDAKPPPDSTQSGPSRPPDPSGELHIDVNLPASSNTSAAHPTAPPTPTHDPMLSSERPSSNTQLANGPQAPNGTAGGADASISQPGPAATLIPPRAPASAGTTGAGAGAACPGAPAAAADFLETELRMIISGGGGVTDPRHVGRLCALVAGEERLGGRLTLLTVLQVSSQEVLRGFVQVGRGAGRGGAWRRKVEAARWARGQAGAGQRVVGLGGRQGFTSRGARAELGGAAGGGFTASKQTRATGLTEERRAMRRTRLRWAYSCRQGLAFTAWWRRIYVPLWLPQLVLCLPSLLDARHSCLMAAPPLRRAPVCATWRRG